MTDAEEKMPSSDTMQSMPRFFIGLLAAAPYIVLGYITMTAGGYLLSYGNTTIIYMVVLASWAVILGLEFLFRSGSAFWKFRFPWFSLAGICFIMTILFVPGWTYPIASRVPRWQHITQAIEWDTHKPTDEAGKNHHYILVLKGYGNPPNQKFLYGWLNNSIEGAPNIPDIDFVKLKFGRYEGYKGLVHYPASREVLQERINLSGLPKERVEKITEDVWSILLQLREGETTVKAQYGQVEPIAPSQTYGEETILGIAIWMILLITVFQFIGYRTIPRNQRPNTT